MFRSPFGSTNSCLSGLTLMLQRHIFRRQKRISDIFDRAYLEWNKQLYMSLAKLSPQRRSPNTRAGDYQKIGYILLRTTSSNIFQTSKSKPRLAAEGISRQRELLGMITAVGGTVLTVVVAFSASTSGTLLPMVAFKQFNSPMSVFAGRGVSGAFSSSLNTAVLLYPSRVNATLLAR